MTDEQLIADCEAGPAKVRQAIAGMTREQLLAAPARRGTLRTI